MRNGLIIFQMLRRESNYINMMKNNEYYSSPEMEIVEIELHSSILNDSININQWGNGGTVEGDAE